MPKEERGQNSDDKHDTTNNDATKYLTNCSDYFASFDAFNIHHSINKNKLIPSLGPPADK